MKLAFAIAMLFATVVLTSAAAERGNAFQALSWGANEAQIRQAFPTVKPAECTDLWRKLSAMTRTVCDRPQVVPYEVAGVPFTLSFNLEQATRRLESVVLFYSGLPEGEEPVAKARMRSRFTTLTEGLEARYGKGGTLFVREEVGRLYMAQSWETPTTRIELTAHLFNSNRVTPNEQYQVWYRPRGGEAAKKL